VSKSKIKVDGQKAVLSLKQDLIASSVNDIRTLIKDAINGEVKDFTIDINGINTIDSMGIGLLISVQNSLAKTGGELAVINISADILDLFKSMRLDQHFSVKGE